MSRTSYCVTCDEVTHYKLDESRGWECKSCGYAIECVDCGLQMRARHDCQREIAAMS